MKNTVVIDLDGTLCNIDHRKHLVGKKEWDAFYEALIKDTPNHWCMELIDAMQARGKRIVLLTARPVRLMDKTREWLDAHEVCYDELVLARHDKDFRQDALLKKIWAQVYGPEKILFAVDDRERVVDMWRSLGVTCLQCDKW